MTPLSLFSFNRTWGRRVSSALKNRYEERKAVATGLERAGSTLSVQGDGLVIAQIITYLGQLGFAPRAKLLWSKSLSRLQQEHDAHKRDVLNAAYIRAVSASRHATEELPSVLRDMQALGYKLQYMDHLYVQSALRQPPPVHPVLEQLRLIFEGHSARVVQARGLPPLRDTFLYKLAAMQPTMDACLRFIDSVALDINTLKVLAKHGHPTAGKLLQEPRGVLPAEISFRKVSVYKALLRCLRQEADSGADVRLGLRRFAMLTGQYLDYEGSATSYADSYALRLQIINKATGTKCILLPDALRLWKEMRYQGHTPGVSVFSSILSVHVRDLFHYSEEVFDRREQYYESTLKFVRLMQHAKATSRVAYQKALQAFALTGHAHDAGTLLQQMCDDGYSIDDTILALYEPYVEFAPILSKLKRTAMRSVSRHSNVFSQNPRQIT